MKKRVVLGMSGGLDSSVAAYLLQKQGFEVVGITLNFSDASRCCSDEDICDARNVARKLQIEHYIVDVKKLFKKNVIDYFIYEYSQGRTPNPCAVCNRKVKFKTLFDKAKKIKADFVATGHYARIKEEHGIHILLKANDDKKDQSYFLARIKKEWLSKVLLPIGEYTKVEVSKIAKQANLPFFKKKESQEVCFIPDNDYRKFLQKKTPELIKPGKIISKHGDILGEHRGLFFYTIGQRKGIQVNINRPLYVTKINFKENAITVGEEADVLTSEFIAKNLNWLVSLDEIPTKASVSIRSQHKPQNASIKCEGNKVIIKFNKPQMAITPAQLAVLYDNDVVLGSGWIKTVDEK